MELFLFVAYVVLSYWAIGQTLYANKIRVGSMYNLFLTRVILGMLLGFVLIPIAIIKKLIRH